jgi:hypothetical protein
MISIAGLSSRNWTTVTYFRFKGRGSLRNLHIVRSKLSVPRPAIRVNHPESKGHWTSERMGEEETQLSSICLDAVKPC